MWISFWRKCRSKVWMISAVHSEINLTLINKTYLVIKTIYVNQHILSPIPVAARSKATVCGCALARIPGSNPTGRINDCLLWVLCVIRYRSLRRADHSSRGVLPSECVSRECDRKVPYGEAMTRNRVEAPQKQYMYSHLIHKACLHQNKN
jgi:hypothetical protein